MNFEDLKAHVKKASDLELIDLEDFIEELLASRAAEDPINVERRKVASAIRKGVVDFMQSKTLMEFLRK